MRSFLLLIVAALLVTGSLVATVGTVQFRDFELRGYINPTSEQDIPFTVARPGVNVELLQYDDADLRSNLELIQASNFVWIRQFSYRDQIESRPGQFDWTDWDRVLAALPEYPALEPVVVLMNTPAWSLEDREGISLSETAPPADLATFASFAYEFAARYGDLIHYYQIWDEPNLEQAWGGLEPRPAEYVALLSVARHAILRADPSATIIAAALAPTTETAGRNISDFRYLDAMYANGAAELMDVVAGKPYGFSSSPLDRQVDESVLNYSRIIALREVMLRHNDGKTPLWASSFGWNALPPEWNGDASIWGTVSVEERTLFSLQALDRAHREWPWLGAMFLHHWQPAVEANSAQWGFALVEPDNTPSPLLQALQKYRYPQRAQNGLFHARNKHARYSGVWQFSELGADIGWLTPSDSQLEFDFFGTDLAMLLREDDYVAFLYPTVDGQPANATQRDSNGNAYVFLRSDSRGPEKTLAPVAKNLPLAEHTLHVVADQGWNRWAIAGYAVGSGDLRAPYNRQIALGILATGLSSLVFLLSVATAPWKQWLPVLDTVISGLGVIAHLLLTAATSVFMMLAMLWTWDSPKPNIFLRDDVNIALALLTGGLLHLSPSFLLSVLLCLILLVLIYHRIETGLVLVLLWAPFFLFPVSLHTYAFPMAEVMLFVTAAGVFVRLMVALGQQLQMRNNAFPIFDRSQLSAIRAMDLAVIGIGLLAIVSLLWTQWPETAFRELRTLIMEPIVFYFLIRYSRPSRRTLLYMFGALVVAGVLVSLIGLITYVFGDGVIAAEQGAKRLLSVYGSPNNVGLLLGRTIPITLAFLVAGLTKQFRLLALASLLIMGLTLMLTQSVGAILLGVPAGIAVVMIGRYQRRAVATVASIGVICIAGFAVLARISARFANILDFSSGTNFVRLRLWESTLAMIRDYPLTGIGLDQFHRLFGGEYLRPDAIWDRDLSHPHNFILDFWTRLSVLGVAVFLVIQFVFWRRAIVIIRHFRGRDPLVFAMALGLIGSMAALLAHGLIDNSVFVIDLAFIFMFQLAALMRLGELAEESDELAHASSQ